MLAVTLQTLQETGGSNLQTTNPPPQQTKQKKQQVHWRFPEQCLRFAQNHRALLPASAINPQPVPTAWRLHSKRITGAIARSRATAGNLLAKSPNRTYHFETEETALRKRKATDDEFGVQYCGWTKSISHQIETNTFLFVGIFLGGAGFCPSTVSQHLSGQ